jgi:hypothetical protein
MMQPTTRSSETTGEKLRAEAEYLHRILFGGDAPDEVKRQYAAVLRQAQDRRLREAGDDGETGNAPIIATGDIDRLLTSGVDLEAVEYALRKKNPANPLTERFRVLCYLVEARPEYFDRFVAERRSFFSGVLALAFHTVRSIYKAIKGGFLARRHGIC